MLGVAFAMALGSRSYSRGYVGYGGLPPGTKALLISNVAVFLVYFLAPRIGLAEAFTYLELIPAAVVRFFFLWQLVTYLFIHGGIGHILFNMLTLYFFGKDLEEAWGTRRFLRYYFVCGIGAGVCVVIANYIAGTPGIRTIGSSGAIYGLILAAAMLWPERMVLFFFFPIKLKYMAIIIGAIAFLQSMGANTGVSEVAHLGGMLIGFLYLRSGLLGRSSRSRGPQIGLMDQLRERYREWKIARARKKFQVYMAKRDRDRGVN
jgi:membrane associated rhomboid family serine protease